jgi:hypothetical protein
MLKIYFKKEAIDFTIVGFCTEHFGAVKIPKFHQSTRK